MQLSQNHNVASSTIMLHNDEWMFMNVIILPLSQTYRNTSWSVVTPRDCASSPFPLPLLPNEVMNAPDVICDCSHTQQHRHGLGLHGYHNYGEDSSPGPLPHTPNVLRYYVPLWENTWTRSFVLSATYTLPAGSKVRS